MANGHGPETWPTKATGPPTQAMGPHRSGAGVGDCLLRGAGDPFVSKFLELKIHQDSTIVKFAFYQKGWEKPIELETQPFQN